MRKSFVVMAAMASTLLGAQAAQADVTCEPGSCIVTGSDTPGNPGGTPVTSASFEVTPAGIGPGFTGSIGAKIGNTISVGTPAAPVAFTDTFEFILPVSGTGGGQVSTTAGSLEGFLGSGDLDFTSVVVNGTAAVINTFAGGLVEFAFASGVNLVSGNLNTITVSGLGRGNGQYSGTINFTPITPAVPEMATWGMMILGFIGMGAAMRRRRNTTVTFGSKRAFA